MSDPFTLVYDALWDLAEAHTPLTDLIKLGNRIKFSAGAQGTTPPTRAPMKALIQAADTPELMLIPSGLIPHLQRTSSSSTIIKRFEWVIHTGEQLADLQLFPVEWELFRAMRDWDSVLSALTWNDKPFVKMASLTRADEGTSERNLNAWFSVWRCEVLMVFSTSDL